MSGINSNAYNFAEHISSGVDERTGMFSTQINMGEFISHRGVGINIPLTVSYSSSDSTDSGFGRGWSLSLSSFDLETHTLNLGSCQSFEIEWNDTKGEYDIPYRKLKDIRVLYIEINSIAYIKVLHKDGRHEYIDYNEGNIVKIVSAQGLEIKFEFGELAGRKTLYRIYDDDSNDIEIDWWSDPFQTHVTHKINNKKVAGFQFIKQGGDYSLIYFKMEGLSEYTQFKYKEFPQSGQKVIISLILPSGLEEELVYINKHRLPDGAPIKYMPYVHQHIRYPGENQEPQIIEYIFSDRNYFGFGSDRNWNPIGDNLFYSTSDFKYESTEIINRTKKTIRIYNKYHLLDEMQVYDNEELIRKEVYTYYADLKKDIKQQVAQYSMLKKQKTTFYYNNNSRSMTLLYEYDDYGNNIKEVYADGAIVEREYYPIAGEGGACPAEPNGFISLLKSEKFIPSSTKNENEFRLDTYTYKKMTRLGSSKDYFVVLDIKEDSRGLKIASEYNQDKRNKFIYGTVNKRTQTLNNYESVTEITTTFNKDDYSITEKNTSHDGLVDTETKHFDYYYKNLIKDIDVFGNATHIEYDILGRKIKSIGHPDFEDYKVERFYEYHTSRDLNFIEETDIHGNKNKSIINRAGNVIKKEIKLSDESDYKCIEEYFYDAFGLVISDKRYDYVNENKITVETSYRYDLNGDVSYVMHQDGREEIITQDPVALTTIHEQKGILKVETKYDISNREIEKNTYDADGKLWANNQNKYDGYGNLTKSIDTDKNEIDYSYDKFDRLASVTRYIEKEAVVESFKYAEFTLEGIYTAIYIDNKLIGKREIDGLLRIKSETTASIIHKYEYDDTSYNPSKILMPRGEIITLEYDKKLQQMIKRKVSSDPSLNTEIEYNKRTCTVNRKKNAHVSIEYEHDSLLRVTKETVKLAAQNTQPEKSASTSYSLKGKIITQSDFNGLTKTIEFDRNGRVKKIFDKLDSNRVVNDYDAITEVFYDDYSRPIKYIKSEDNKNIELILTLNALGAETKRELKIDNVSKFTLDQYYNDAMLFQSKIYKSQEGNIYNQEVFYYDSLYRLIGFFFVGNGVYPTDSYGNEIKNQFFKHDKYGNVIEVRTQYTNSKFDNIQKLIYDLTYPTRLTKVENTNKQFPPTILFHYDGAGNIVNDEFDRWYRYNALGQLNAVISRNHQYLSQYIYNPDGEMIAQIYPDGTKEHLYYAKGRFSNEFNGDISTSYTHDVAGLGARYINQGQNFSHQLLCGNGQGSTLKIFEKKDNIETLINITYSPYGVANIK